MRKNKIPEFETILLSDYGTFQLQIEKLQPTNLMHRGTLTNAPASPLA